MTDVTATFFESVRDRGYEPLLAKGTGVLRFESVDGDDVERWFVTITKGDVAISQDDGEPTCSVRGPRSLLNRIAEGRTNAMAAALRGELVLEGDPALLLLFSRLFPGPPTSSHPRSQTSDSARQQ
jgi:predicted lipid carrier protein YhbT